MDKNIYDKPLQTCSKQPLTGFYRDGYCKTGAQDTGTHTVCGQIEEDFLKFSKKRGNNLYGVVKPGDHWCLCQERWNEAYESNEIMAPLVKKAATNKKTRKHVKSNILQQFSRKQRNILKKKGGKTKKRFLYHPNNPDKSFDVYIYAIALQELYQGTAFLYPLGLILIYQTCPSEQLVRCFSHLASLDVWP